MCIHTRVIIIEFLHILGKLDDEIGRKLKEKEQILADIKYKKTMLDDIENQFANKVSKFHEFEREYATKQTELAHCNNRIFCFLKSNYLNLWFGSFSRPREKDIFVKSKEVF